MSALVLVTPSIFLVEELDSHQNIEKDDFIYISKNLNHKISNTDSINQLEIIIARNIRI